MAKESGKHPNRGDVKRGQCWINRRTGRKYRIKNSGLVGAVVVEDEEGKERLIVWSTFYRDYRNEE